MKRDFKAIMLYLIFGLPFFLLLFMVALYVGNCGFSTDCSQASQPEIIHTPIPTLIPATLPPQGLGTAEVLGGEMYDNRAYFAICMGFIWLS